MSDVARSPAPGWTALPTNEADGRALVLYVDVDDQSWSTASERLRRAYRLLRAENDREACELVRTYANDLVAVMLDIDLPGSVLDGILLTRILRQRVPSQALPPFARNLPRIDVPILFVTARTGRRAQPLPPSSSPCALSARRATTCLCTSSGPS